ncbi:MAG: alpha/beta fold hydrolase [Lysobacterales bacterium]|jgi:pimeloyl-ACP methyl ester carboxylesterase
MAASRRRSLRRSRRALWLALLVLPLLAYLASGLLAPQWLLQAALRLDAWRSDAERIELQVDGERWVLLQRGALDPAQPVWLLLHGFTGSKENWLPLLRALPADVPVLMPDLPGWGESERRAGIDYGYAAQAARVAALIEALELTQVHLVGHSMGGGIAALVAARHPRGLRSVTLMSAAGVRFRDNAFGAAVLRGAHPFAVASGDQLDAYLALVFREPPLLPWPLKSALVERRVRDDGFERQVLDAIARGPEAFLPGESAGAIALPTLVLGCAADPVVDPSAAELYAQRIAGAQRITFDGCAHMPMMELPAAVAEVLRRFSGMRG